MSNIHYTNGDKSDPLLRRLNEVLEFNFHTHTWVQGTAHGDVGHVREPISQPWKWMITYKINV